MMSAQPSRLDPALGRGFWRHLHAFAGSYPQRGTAETRHLANAFLASYRDGLMRTAEGKCSCRTVMAKAMEFCPVPLDTRENFVKWTEALHELVNLKLGKSRFKPGLNHRLLTREAWIAIMPPELAVPSSLTTEN